MTITEIASDKKRFLPILLQADEEERMIDRYLNRGRLFVLNGGEAVCVVTDEGEGVLEIKNLAVAAEFRRRGYGSAMIDFVCGFFAGEFSLLQVGTGESRATLSFYEKNGFVFFRRIRNFFLDGYTFPVYEEGKRLVDMIVLRKPMAARHSLRAFSAIETKNLPNGFPSDTIKTRKL